MPFTHIRFIFGIWYTSADGKTHAGVGAVGNHGLKGRNVYFYRLIKFCTWIRRQALPCFDSVIPGLSLGGELPACQIFKGGAVGGNHTGACTSLDRHIAQGHTPFHVQGSDCRTAVLKDMTGAAANTDSGDQSQDHVFRGNPFSQLPIEADLVSFRHCLEQALRGEHMSHLAGPDAKSQGTEGSMGRGVAVPAHDGHAWLG